MELNWVNYSGEVVEFLCAETLRKIDYGILDLSKIRNPELKEVFRIFEELLSMELRLNYLENSTGLFRVQALGGRYCYREFDYIIEADTVFELKQLVLAENRIWYVFDDILAGKLTGEVEI